MNTVLVIKLGALGDFVLADAAFRHIYNHHTAERSHTRLVLLTTPAFKKFAEKQGYFDDVIALPRFKYWNFAGMKQVLRVFKTLKPTHIYDLQMVKRTRIYAQMWSVLARVMGHSFTWIGHIPKHTQQGAVRYVALDHSNFNKPPLERFDALLSNAGLSKLPTLDIRRLGAEHTDFQSIPKPYIVVVPSTSPAFGGAKTWPLSHYKALVHQLTQQGYACVLVGGPNDHHRDLCINDQVIDLTGKTDFEHIIYLSTHALCAIGGDTGPIHMAAASLCPVFVMFSKKAPPAAQVGARGPLYHHLSVDDLSQLQAGDVMEKLAPFLRNAKEYRDTTQFYHDAVTSVSPTLETTGINLKR